MLCMLWYGSLGAGNPVSLTWRWMDIWSRIADVGVSGVLVWRSGGQYEESIVHINEYACE